MSRLPSDRTHKDDARIEASNFILVLLALSVPFLFFGIVGQLLLGIAAGFLFIGFGLDITLTLDGIQRGYKEGNIYKFLPARLGDGNGVKALFYLGLGIRAVLIVAFQSNPILLLLIAFVAFLAPLWNALTMMSFRDDIVLSVNATVGEGNQTMTFGTGEKKRLETIKDAEDEKENCGD